MNQGKINPALCAAVHTVAPGETMYSIAGIYGTDHRRLMKLNGISDPRSLAVGQKICIPMTPGEAPSVQCSSNRRYHIVQAGETLYGISRKYGVPLSKLMACNPSLDPYHMQIGTRLNIPEAAAAPQPQTTAASPSSGQSTGQQTAAASSPVPETQPGSSASGQAEAVPAPQTQPGVSTPAPAVPAPSPDQGMQSAGSVTSAPGMSDSTLHTVSEDDTLTSILTRYGMCFHALLCENPYAGLAEGVNPQAGSTLRIPSEDIYRRCPQNQSYVIKSGDTLQTVARAHGMTSDDLLQLNPCSSPMDFSVMGTRIRV